MLQKSSHTVCVLNKDKKPLMPTRPAKAKWLLKNGKAKVIHRSPFTIQLTYQIENPILQPVSLAFDDGETVGVAVIQKNRSHQRVVFWAQMRCRGKEITDLLSKRRRLRKARRKRKWNRRQKKRFTNQKLPPSVRADIEAKMRLIHQILSIIPISEILWEPLALCLEKEKKKNRKNAPRLLPPYLQENKHRLAYQLSEKKRKRVIERDGERCCICYRKVTMDTAYIYQLNRKSRHGDLMTLCNRCSSKIQDERFVISLDPSKFSSIRGAARLMHGRNELGRRLKAIGLPIFLVNGWRTGQCRKILGLQKSHLNDAVAIGSKGEKCLLMESFYLVRLRARHQRKLFYQNPGDRDIQRIRKEMVLENDHEVNRKSRSIRRRVRRKLYQKRYGKGGVKNKR
jgi:N6-L-threonylcarbamoyladenine synthase